MSSMCQVLVRVGDTTLTKISQPLTSVQWEIETSELALAECGCAGMQEYRMLREHMAGTFSPDRVGRL